MFMAHMRLAHTRASLCSHMFVAHMFVAHMRMAHMLASHKCMAHTCACPRLDLHHCTILTFSHYTFAVIGAFLAGRLGDHPDELWAPRFFQTESVFFFLISFFLGVNKHSSQRSDRNRFITEMEKNNDTRRKEALINSMLPKDLTIKMKSNNKELMASTYPKVSILFCAIANFDQLCEALSALEVSLATATLTRAEGCP